MSVTDTTQTALLAICIPTFRDDASPLIRMLSDLPEAERCPLLLYDDGSGDPLLAREHANALAAYPGSTRHEAAPENRGRSFARNWLVTHSPADWILLIDADMLPDQRDFLESYIAAIGSVGGPALIAGGFSLDQVSPEHDKRLHYGQSRQSDCVGAETRSADPGRFVFSSNILVHRSVMQAIPFDEAFTGWGWEDIEWGMRVADEFPILHIDNTATHLGLEEDSRLLDKFGSSGSNFARLVQRHPEATARMPLLKAAQRVKGIPLLAPISRAIAAARFLPLQVRVAALKLYRAASYAPYVEPVG